MSNKKTFDLSESQLNPSALIIGSGNIPGYLMRILEEKGCSATLSETPNLPVTAQNQFNYIFIFGWHEKIKDLINMLNKDGKLLLIEDEPENLSEIIPSSKIRILVTDPLRESDVKKTSDRILETMFSISAATYVDISLRLRKRSYPIKRKVEEYRSSRIETSSPLSPLTYPKPVQPKTSSTRKTAKEPFLLERKFHTKPILVAILILFIMTAAIAGSFILFAIQVKNTMKSAELHLAEGEIDKVKQDLNLLKSQLDTATSTYNVSTNLLFPLRNTSLVMDFGEFLSISATLLTATHDAFNTAENLNLSSFASLENKVIYASEVENAEKSLDKALLALTKAIDLTKRTTLPYFPKNSTVAYLNNYLEKVETIKTLLPFFKTIVLQDKESIYLILFQNNMELRPTGGFIGSFGIFKADNGKIGGLKIYDVYDADGQLKGHVDPPLPIRKHLNQPNWFLRDSNFNPDFATSANQAAWFLEKELAIKTAGVIGVNIFFIQDILRSTGPIKLPEFNNEIIMADNFFTKTHEYTNDDFFPGSIQKKNFLNSVANSLQEKMFTGKKISWGEFATVIKKALDEKNLLLYFTDSQIQTLAEKGSWAGRVINIGCTRSNNFNCIADYLHIVEANLGVNKVNYFITKTVSVEKVINNQGILTTITKLIYKNSSVENQKGGGTYTNYLRFYVPRNSKLISAEVNGRPLTPLELDTESFEPDKTIFGFLIRVNPQAKVEVKITYVHPQTFTNDTQTFQFSFQKQAGDKSSPITLSLSFPPLTSFTPVNFSPSVKSLGKLEYSTDTTVDRIFAFEVKSNR